MGGGRRPKREFHQHQKDLVQEGVQSTFGTHSNGKDKTKHEFCSVCGYCLDCGDCERVGCGSRAGKYPDRRKRK